VHTVAAVAVLIVACQGGDEAGPAELPGPSRLTIEAGDTTPFAFDSGDSAIVVTFRAATSGIVALFGQADAGGASVQIIDSTNGLYIEHFTLVPDPGPGRLEARRAERLTVSPAQVYRFEITRLYGYPPPRGRLWLYIVNPAPERVPPSLSLGDTLTEETLENSADIDTFHVNAAAPEEHIGYLLGSPGIPNGTVRLLATAPNGNWLSYPVTGGKSDVDLEGQATERFVVQGSAGYTVTVSGVDVRPSDDRPEAVSGPYQVQFRKVLRAPESVPVTMAPGDTLDGERIDYVGDIDDFQVPVVAGALYNAFLQATEPAQPGARLVLRFEAGALALPTSSTIGDTALRSQYTGLLRAPTDGMARVEVSGSMDNGALQRGGYRVFVYPVDTLPELVSAQLSLGDSVDSETIEYPGDMDVFSTGTGGDTLNVVLHRGAASEVGLDLRWPGAEGTLVRPCWTPEGAGERACPTGMFVAPDGGASIAVSSQLNGTLGFSGAYRLSTYRISAAPEGSSPAITPDVPKTGVVEVPGDFDVYTFEYQKGQLLDLQLAGGGQTTANALAASVTDSAGNWQSLQSMLGIPTGRFALPRSGSYKVFVGGYSSGQVAEETGPYSFLLRTYPTATETVGPTIALEDSVTGEAIDSLGDVDDFILAASPGTEVQAVLYMPQGPGGNPFGLEAWRPGDSVPLVPPLGMATGRVIVPAGGQLVVRARQPRPPAAVDINAAFNATGTYHVALHEIHRTPENVSAAISQGVEVIGERIDVVGDVDEYVFGGASGQAVSLYLNTFESNGSLKAIIRLIDLSTGTTLGTVSTASQTPITSAAFTLPATRSYLIRVESIDEREGTGSYRFAIQ